MLWGQLIFGGVLLGISFGFLFIPTFEKVIQVCLMGNLEVHEMAGVVTYISTCDEQLRILTNGFRMPALVIFWGLTILGAWFVVTGMQSRSLITLKK